MTRNTRVDLPSATQEHRDKIAELLRVMRELGVMIPAAERHEMLTAIRKCEDQK